MRKLLVIFLLGILTSYMYGQNIIGYSSYEVKEYFRTNNPDLAIDSNFKNPEFKYLKFVDSKSNMTTVLVFLGKKDKCSAVRAIYDLTLEEEVVNSLNEKYKSAGKNLWTDKTKKGGARISYSKGEWFITVDYKPIK